MGEARRKTLARESAFATGKPWPVPLVCPACGSTRTGRSRLSAELQKTLGDCDYAICGDCRAIWEPFPAEGVVEDPVVADPCDNCAFRPGSPEQADKEGWKKFLDSLKPDPETGMFAGRFYCHKNVPIDVAAGPGNFLFPQGPDGEYDQSKMRVCSGFLRMFWARLAKKESGGSP
jgi:hypothetical protein